jgi:hypothetical protein
VLCVVCALQRQAEIRIDLDQPRRVRSLSSCERVSRGCAPPVLGTARAPDQVALRLAGSKSPLRGPMWR